MSSITKRNTILLFVFVVSVALVLADLAVFAQNGNGNTQDDQTRGGQMTSNDNTTNTGRTTGRRRRRGRRTTSANSGMDSMNMSNDNTGNVSGDTSMQGNTNMSGDMSGNMNMGTGRRRRRRRAAAATTTTTTDTTTTTMTSSAPSEQTDLSGSYTGSLNCSALGASGNGTLSVTGNQFTWTPEGGSPVSGRVTAVTTRGYTGVAMQVGESTAPGPGGAGGSVPTIVSLRARKAGDRLTLSSVAGGRADCSFAPAGGGGTRRRGRRSRTSGMGNMNMSQ